MTLYSHIISTNFFLQQPEITKDFFRLRAELEEKVIQHLPPSSSLTGQSQRD